MKDNIDPDDFMFDKGDELLEVYYPTASKIMNDYTELLYYGNSQEGARKSALDKCKKLAVQVKKSSDETRYIFDDESFIVAYDDNLQDWDTEREQKDTIGPECQYTEN